MGRDRIRYLVYQNGRWRWHPSKAMREAGFRLVNLSRGVIINGEHVPSEEDNKRAIELNTQWDHHRRGLPAPSGERTYAPGTIGHAYKRVMALREQERLNKGIVWTTEQHSRDDWPRAWKWIGRTLGEFDPKIVTPEMLIGDKHKGIIGLRPLVAQKVSESEAHRVIKVWRALWKKMGTFGYCDKDQDPSLAFANSAPGPRQEEWREGEAVRLVKAAWRLGYNGLAALLATAWDSTLSPIDARGLNRTQMQRDRIGVWFAVDRAKTTRDAIATPSKRSERLLEAYLAQQPAQPVGKAPIFRNRSGRAYSKDTLGDDFRAVRAIVFGAGETRQLADFRRSGANEALEGKAPPEQLSSKMANSLSTSNRLHKTYAPVRLASVRAVDEHRRQGRARLREQNSHEIPTTPAGDSNNGVQKKAK